MSAHRDLIVVGGGPSGLATAIFAAQKGMTVTLLERGALPQDKACGEGLMPAGVRLLEDMGVRVGSGEHALFEGIRYVDGPIEAEGRFRNGPGMGVRRPVLSRALTERAAALGVELLDRARLDSFEMDASSATVRFARGARRARLLVAADGLHSRLRVALGLQRVATARRGRRHGIRRHFRVRPWSRFVEVHWCEAGEAYVTPVAPDEVGVAVLWWGPMPAFGAMLERFPRLHRALDGAPATSLVKGASGFRQSAHRRYRGRAALVGDAAGYLDALTGEGIALGFRGAEALAAVVAAGRPLADYERRYRALSRRYYQLTRLMLFVSRNPRVRRRTIATLARRPGLFDRFLSLYHEALPWRALAGRDLYHLVEGLCCSEPPGSS